MFDRNRALFKSGWTHPSEPIATFRRITAQMLEEQMKTVLTIAAIIVGFALPKAADAQQFRAVTDRAEFMQLLTGKTLNIRLYNLSLDVRPDGNIAGDALGWDVSGNWSWQDGFFCRELDWGGDPIPYNCQLVEVAGNQMRFTTDRGAGDSATFGLR